MGDCVLCSGAHFTNENASPESPGLLLVNGLPLLQLYLEQNRPIHQVHGGGLSWQKGHGTSGSALSSPGEEHIRCRGEVQHRAWHRLHKSDVRRDRHTQLSPSPSTGFCGAAKHSARQLAVSHLVFPGRVEVRKGKERRRSWQSKRHNGFRIRWGGA